MATAACWEGRGYSTEVCEAFKRSRINRKRLAWLDFYLGEAAFNATEAARLSKFKSPEKAGPLIARELADVIDAISREKSALLRLEGDQIMQGIADIALNGANETNRLKAYELLAKIHGMLNEKLAISIDRRSLLKQLDLLLPKKIEEPKVVGSSKVKAIEAEVIGKSESHE